jgi:hypothetical protein
MWQLKRPSKCLGPDVVVTRIDRNKSRVDRLSDAQSLADDAKSEVEELAGEIESWKDNLPESLQNGEKADQLDECLTGLQEIQEALESVVWEVEFPGAFGA